MMKKIGSQLLVQLAYVFILFHVIGISADGIEQKKQGVSVAIEIPRKKIYVGQEVPFIARIFIPHKKNILNGIGLPEIPGIVFNEQDSFDKTTNSNMTKGYDGAVMKYQGSFYPTQTGRVTIEGIYAVYQVRTKKSAQPTADIFDIFWGGRSWKKKKAYASPQAITVLPLPQTDKLIQAVGMITNMTAAVSTTTIPISSATVLTIAIDSDSLHTLQQIEDAPFLATLSLPDTLKAYPAQSEIITTRDGYRKIFKLTLQPLAIGEITINSQELVTFNPQSERIVSNRTKPLKVYVEPDSSLGPHDTNSSNEQVKHDDASNSQIEQDQLNRMLQQYAHAGSCAVYIPWYWLLVLLLIPFLFYVYTQRNSIVSMLMSYDYSSKAGILKKFRIFKKQAERLEKRGNYKELYKLVKKHISAIYSHEQILTDASLQNHMQNILNNAEFAWWKQYYQAIQRVSSYSPADIAIDNKQKQYLFTQTYQLISMLKKNCQRNYTSFLIGFCMLLNSWHMLLSSSQDINNKIDNQIVAQAVQLKKLHKNRHITDQTYLKLRSHIANIIQRDKLYTHIAHEKPLYHAMQYIPIIVLQCLLIVCWCIVLGLLYNNRYMWAGLMSIVFMLCGTFYVWRIIYSSYPEGLITQQVVPIYLGPKATYPKIARIYYLDEVTIHAQKDDWCKIKTALHNGWIRCSGITPIDTQHYNCKERIHQ